MKIILNRDFRRHKKGTVIDLENLGHEDNIYWTRRLKESETDGCVSVLNDESSKSKSRRKKHDDGLST